MCWTTKRGLEVSLEKESRWDAYQVFEAIENLVQLLTSDAYQRLDVATRTIEHSKVQAKFQDALAPLFLELLKRK
jgi:hypothetical protein